MKEITLSDRIAVDDLPNLTSENASISGPVQPSERIMLLDVLRGFALLGILQANWANISGALSILPGFLVDGAFFTTFSFLFGLGFAIQLIRAEEAKRPFILRYLWRTLILFLIGVMHMVFIYPGDILLHYSVLAGLLLFVRRWRPGLIIALATAVLVFSMSPRMPNGSVWTRIDPEQVEAGRLHTQLREATRPLLIETYGQSVSRQAGEVSELLTDYLSTVQGGRTRQGATLFMFLLGLYAGRRRIFRDAAHHTRFLAWVAGVALVFGLAGRSFIFGEFFGSLGISLPEALDGWSLAKSLGNIGLSLFYLAGVTLLFTHWRLARRALAPLAYVGRMGLTNYLMQSIVFAIVLGRGFGLIDYPGFNAPIVGWYSLLLINSFFVMQIVYSYWWFRYFQFGPFEWAWRSLTWFRIQPMRIAPSDKEFEPMSG